MSAYDEPGPAEYRPPAPRRPRSPALVAAVVSLAVSAAVVLAMQFLLVPGGVGWRKLVHEGTVSVPGSKPFTVHYPSSFSRPPSLSVEAQGHGNWFFSIDEQTTDHFVITNTTVNRNDGTPVLLTIKWRAEGGR